MRMRWSKLTLQNCRSARMSAGVFGVTAGDGQAIGRLRLLSNLSRRRANLDAELDLKRNGAAGIGRATCIRVASLLGLIGAYVADATLWTRDLASISCWAAVVGSFVDCPAARKLGLGQDEAAVVLERACFALAFWSPALLNLHDVSEPRLLPARKTHHSTRKRHRLAWGTYYRTQLCS